MTSYQSLTLTAPSKSLWFKVKITSADEGDIIFSKHCRDTGWGGGGGGSPRVVYNEPVAVLHIQFTPSDMFVI